MSFIIILFLLCVGLYLTLNAQRLGAPDQASVDWHPASVLVYREHGGRKAPVDAAGLGAAQELRVPPRPHKAVDLEARGSLGDALATTTAASTARRRCTYTIGAALLLKPSRHHSFRFATAVPTDIEPHHSNAPRLQLGVTLKPKKIAGRAAGFELDLRTPDAHKTAAIFGPSITPVPRAACTMKNSPLAFVQAGPMDPWAPMQKAFLDALVLH